VETAIVAGKIGGALPATGAITQVTVIAGNLGGTAVGNAAFVAETMISGSLAAAGALNAASIATTYVAAGLQGAGSLSGAAVSSSYLAGTLADLQSGNLFGAAVAGAIAAGQLAGAAAAAGAVVSATTVAASLAATAAASGAIVSGSLFAAALTGQGPGAINFGVVSFALLAGELITLTPAGPEETGGGGLARRTPPRAETQRAFEDRMVTEMTRNEVFDNPAYTPYSPPAPRVATDPIFTAEMTAELAALLAADQRRRVLALLMLMAEMSDSG
jgi:hypothetical protein